MHAGRYFELQVNICVPFETCLFSDDDLQRGDRGGAPSMPTWKQRNKVEVKRGRE